MAAAVALALTTAGVALSQNADDILTKTSQTYQNLKTGEFAATTVSETRIGATDSKSETQLLVAFVKPAKMRVEYKYPNGGDWVRITDGSSAVHYQAWTKEYEKGPASPADLDLMAGTPMTDYARLSERAKDAKLVRQEPLQVGGAPVDCYVIELPDGSGGTTAYWIDKTRYLVLQEQSTNEGKSKDMATASQNVKTITYTEAKANEPVPDAEFVFSPPPGAKVTAR